MNLLLQLLTFFPPLCAASSAFRFAMFRWQQKGQEKVECYTTNYAFRFLINLFEIFRVEMRRQFSTDVNVSCFSLRNLSHLQHQLRSWKLMRTLICSVESRRQRRNRLTTGSLSKVPVIA